MATHSSTLAWKIPWMEEPGRLQSMGSLRVRHDWATLLSLFTFMHWRRKWQPTPVFLSGESQGWGSLVGCRLWGHTESDTTEVTQQQYCIVYMDNVFIYSSADGHLDCFHTLASVNNAPMNIASMNMLLWCTRIFLNQCFEGFWIFYFFQLKKKVYHSHSAFST